MYLVCSPEEELQEVTGFPGREEGHVFRGNIGQRGPLTPGGHSLQGQHRAEGHPYSR